MIAAAPEATARAATPPSSAAMRFSNTSWVEFVSLENGLLTLAFRGECSKCEILERCENWIAQKIEDELGMKIRVCGIRKKPFFWDS